MEIFKIIALGILICVVIIIVKQIKPEFAVLVLIAGSIIMLCYLFNYFTNILGVFDKIISKTGINAELFSIILKIVGIGYLIEFAANICSDSGNPAIADKIVLGGKLIILTVSMPIITNLLDIIVELL
ncbi:MAG: stage III sporulation AC/AD family protein [Firmicutes bacterium]|nr:stage III sporulation AC/AD family protein [Bacillota bacterium]MDY5042002.1 SpoIIIAC/SpoIIIAD family protein [Eubacteriales bacterium]